MSCKSVIKMWIPFWFEYPQQHDRWLNLYNGYSGKPDGGGASFVSVFNSTSGTAQQPNWSRQGDGAVCACPAHSTSGSSECSGHIATCGMHSCPPRLQAQKDIMGTPQATETLSWLARHRKSRQWCNFSQGKHKTGLPPSGARKVRWCRITPSFSGTFGPFSTIERVDLAVLTTLFCNGVHHKLQKELACQDAELELDELIFLVIKLDQHHRGKHYSASPARTTARVRGYAILPPHLSTLTLPPEDSSQELMQWGTSQLSCAEEWRRARRLCLYCGGVGNMFLPVLCAQRERVSV